MKIALDIGHQSRGDQGAVSACGLSEHEYWAERASFLKKEWELLGHTVRIFRREDFGGIIPECRAVNDWGAELAVSLHLNSSDNGNAGGHEVIHYPGSRKGKELAQFINGELNGTSGLKDRGIKAPYQGRGNTFLQKIKTPAVIVEAGFLSNPADVNTLKVCAAQIAVQIVRGVHKYSQSK